MDEPSAETQIRALIERWVAAVHTGDLDGVLAGSDVAYAEALLRCVTPDELAERPERRLRLTVGLGRVVERWVVAHEPHSFALAE